MTSRAETAPNRTVRWLAAAWGGAIVFGLAVGASGSASLQHALVDDGPGCPLRMLTGIPCPLCGMTHATVALGGGHLHESLAYHPFAPIVIAGMLAMMAMLAVGRGDALMRGRRLWWILGAIAAIWVLRFIV